MNLLNGAHIQESVQPIEYCCYSSPHPQTTYFTETYYDPMTKQLHYTYLTSSGIAGHLGPYQTHNLVTLDAQSLDKVGETPVPYMGESASKGFDAVVFNNLLFGVSSGDPKIEGWPAMSWIWNGQGKIEFRNERSRELKTANATSSGIAVDIQRGLVVETDGMHIFIRETGGAGRIIGVIEMTSFVEETSILMGHDPITDHLIFLDWERWDEGRNRSFFVRSMADLLVMSRPWEAPNTGEGNGTPTPPSNDDGECVIPQSGPWPPCATGGW